MQRPNGSFPNGQRFHHDFVKPGKLIHPRFVALKKVLVPACMSADPRVLGLYGKFESSLYKALS
jgi:hypothetical protein